MFGNPLPGGPYRRNENISVFKKQCVTLRKLIADAKKKGEKEISVRYDDYYPFLMYEIEKAENVVVCVSY